MALNDENDYILKAARKVKQKIDDKADAYLAGEYDPGEHLRKNVVRGTTTALVVLSLLTGLAFSNPAEITDEQAAASSYKAAPIVMDVDDFMNADVEDDDDDADEQKSSRAGIVARFKQAVMTLPQSVRLLIVVPLWAAGTALMTVISFLWSVIFTSPLGAFIASFTIGFLVLLGLFTATAKMLFPDIPVRKLLSKRNIIALGITALVLSALDAVAPLYWHQYPAAAALVKLVFGGTIIGILSVRTKNLFHKIKYHGLPPVEA